MARTLLIAAAVALVAAVLIFLPIRVPYTVTVPGKVFPSEEWILVRDQDGSLGAILRNHLRGTVESYSVNQFERGDAVRVSFSPGIRPTSRVTLGDTIGAIYSNETQRQLANLTGELARVMSAVAFYSTGEKEPIVEQARATVQRAQEQVRQQQALVDRMKRLEQNQHVAAQDVELAETQLEVYRAEVRIAEAALEAARTGAKPQQIDLTRAEAEALQREIQMLEDRLNMFTITSPISGIAVRSFGIDTLLTVKGTDAFVVVMPVPLRRHAYVDEGSKVEIEVIGSRERTLATVQQFGDAVHSVNGEAVVMATAYVADPGARLIPGAMVRCTIDTGKVPIVEYLKRILA